MIIELIIGSQHVPPAASFPLPLFAVQVGHSMGNLCSFRRAVTCPRKHSRQKVCLQGSGRAIESSGTSSKHIPHTNNRWADLASSARCAERTRSSLSNSFCSRIASRILSSRSDGGDGGLPKRPSARPELEPAERELGPKGSSVDVDALEDDGVEWYVDEESCRGGENERSKYFGELDDGSSCCCCCCVRISLSCSRLRASASLISPSRRCCSPFRNSFCDRNSAISACIDNCARLDSRTACHNVGVDVSTPCGTNTCPL